MGYNNIYIYICVYIYIFIGKQFDPYPTLAQTFWLPTTATVSTSRVHGAPCQSIPSHMTLSYAGCVRKTHRKPLFFCWSKSCWDPVGTLLGDLGIPSWIILGEKMVWIVPGWSGRWFGWVASKRSDPDLLWRYTKVVWYKYKLSFLGMDQGYGSYPLGMYGSWGMDLGLWIAQRGRAYGSGPCILRRGHL